MSILTKTKNNLRNHLINIPGWRTNRKIVVFESDDWGSIRMPSKEAYNKLLQNGIRVDKSLYDTYDTLECREDLELMFNVLSNYKDTTGNYPVFTFNTVMGNPDFEKIKQDQFEKFHHEDLFTSYEHYNNDNVSDLWNKAVDAELISPQFHAREHLNTSLWMEALRKNYRETKIAFDHRFFGLKTKTPSTRQKNYLAAYWPSDGQDLKKKIEILKEGLEMFEKTFGFRSKSFVACNYIYPEAMEKDLAACGIKYIQTQSGHISPDISSGENRIRRHYVCQKNSLNQTYLVRNCTFEPTLDRGIDSVSHCMKSISTAFRWKKPAIISSHRINYVGGLSIKNRENGIRKLNELFDRILTKWPGVEFLSTSEIGSVIMNHR